MALLLRAWIGSARIRRRRARGRRRRRTRWTCCGSSRPAGPSWTWAACGASTAPTASRRRRRARRAVTGVDLMPASERFESEHRAPWVGRALCPGDVHDAAVARAIGEHDLVWCAGVLYHAPSPVLTLAAPARDLPRAARPPHGHAARAGGRARRLRLLSGARRARPGSRGPAAGVGRAIAVTEPFDPDEAYGNWWWGITPSALRGMLEAAGFAVDELREEPFLTTAIARPV